MYLVSATPEHFPTMPHYNEQFSGKGLGRKESPGRKESKGSVLVVDDAPDIALMLAAYLERAGYRVVPVFSGDEALDAATREHFEVIVSDIGLPSMDGYELAKHLRALPDYLTTTLIAVTGFAEYEDQQKAFSAGFDAHLKKPIDPMRLIDLIAHLGC